MSDWVPPPGIEEWADVDRVAAVRRMLDEGKRLDEGDDPELFDHAHAALDSLSAELKQLRMPAWDRLIAREVRRLETELEQAKADGDEVRVALRDALALVNTNADDADRLESRLDKALAALRDIQRMKPEKGAKLARAVEIARAAIAEIEGEG